MRGYVYLALSILFEMIGSTFLKLSNGFTNMIPSILLIFFYLLSFSIFVQALKTIALSVGYSIWSGVGTAGTALVGIFVFKEVLSSINILGLLLIIVGVVIMQWNKKEESDERTYATE